MKKPEVFTVEKVGPRQFQAVFPRKYAHLSEMFTTAKPATEYLRVMQESIKGHDGGSGRCRKSDIRWRKRPDIHGGDGGQIPWYGKCRICRRKVVEYFFQDEALHDAETNERID